MLSRALICLLFILPSFSATELIVTVSGITSDQGKPAARYSTQPPASPWTRPRPPAFGSRPNSARSNAGLPTSTRVPMRSRFPTIAIAIERPIPISSGCRRKIGASQNDVRPRPRAPRFEEARFVVKDGDTLRQTVRLAR